MRKIFGIFIAVSLMALAAGPLSADTYTIGPADLRIPPGTTATFAAGSHGEYVYKTSSETGSLIAPVHLPSGAIIKNIRLIFYDNNSSPSAQILCWLLRVNKFTGDYYVIFNLETMGTEDAIRSIVDSTCPVPAKRLVNNGAVNYGLTITFLADCDINCRVYGATITYE